MFSAFVLVLELSMMISLICMIPTLFTLRIVISIKYINGTKKRLYAVLMPFSIGFLEAVDENLKIVKVYKRLLIMFSVLAIIGILFTVYQAFI